MHSQAQEDRLYVYTLGRFALYWGGETSGNPNLVKRRAKMWELLKFLLAKRHRIVNADMLFATFWPDLNEVQARQCLYTCVHRLRAALGSGHRSDTNSQLVVVGRGLYSISPTANVWLDVDVFNELCEQGFRTAARAPNYARELLSRAIDLYQGKFLAENLYDDWVKESQALYQDKFRQAVLTAARILINSRQFWQARGIVEKGLRLEPFDESLHIKMLEILLGEQALDEALDYYIKATTMLYQEFGVTPSARMVEIYRQLKAGKQAGSKTKAVDLGDIRKELVPRQAVPGPLVCDTETFQKIFYLEQRRMRRWQPPVILASLRLQKVSDTALL